MVTTIRSTRVARAFVALALLSLSGCGALPRSGPLAAQMQNTGEDGEALASLVAPLTAETVDMIGPAPAEPGFSGDVLSAAPLDVDMIGRGDVIETVVWEGAEGGLFSTAGGATMLPLMTVDNGGNVFAPFAGRIRAAGRTPDQLRRAIGQALSSMTLSPQVSVRVVEASSRRFSVQGAVGAPGIYDINHGAGRLTQALAAAGGVAPETPAPVLTLRRNGRDMSEPLDAVLGDPGFDIALRPGDSIIVAPQRSRFTALGALGSQAEIVFPRVPLDLLGALGAASGLRDFDADPSAVFVLRRERPEIADALLEGAPPSGLPRGAGRPIVYRLDLTDPEAFFIARNFEMRGGDAVFVSNAPITELRKVFQVFSTVLAPVQQTNAIAAR